MSEEVEIKQDGAKPQHNSGRGYRNKGDALLGPFCVDIKEYVKSFSLSIDVWRKICSDAIHSQKEPALKIVLGKDNNRVRLWVVSDDMFKRMLDTYVE